MIILFVSINKRAKLLLFFYTHKFILYKIKKNGTVPLLEKTPNNRI